jgi:hypothetical protein
MRANRDNPRPARREIFVLTLEEKKTICFVLIAFALGLATKHYRDRHPQAAPKPDLKVRGHASARHSPASQP